MTTHQLLHIINKYLRTLSAHIVEKDSICTLCHAKWMLSDMLSWPIEGNWDKYNRWVGFVQGVFYVEDIYTIDEMREHNRIST